jgi:hypothetical protein
MGSNSHGRTRAFTREKFTMMRMCGPPILYGCVLENGVTREAPLFWRTASAAVAARNRGWSSKTVEEGEVFSQEGSEG